MLNEGGGLAEAVAQLYGLAPGVFIKERNALAAQAKSNGDRNLADRVKVLVKPSLGAWLVNQLARHRPGDLARVLGLSEALRQAQDERDGDELRRLSRVRAEVLREVITSGRELGDELGHVVSDAIVGEVERALRAALADEDAAAALVSGQLVRGLESTGFGGIELDAVLAAPELGPGDVLDEAIEPSSEGLGDRSSGAATGRAKIPGHLRAAPEATRPARQAGSGPPPSSEAERRASDKGSGKGSDKAGDTADGKASERAGREEERQRKAQQKAADQAASDAAEAARAADRALSDARHEADETADQLEELAAELSRQRDRIRELELAARQARREARDADRARRHLGLV